MGGHWETHSRISGHSKVSLLLQPCKQLFMLISDSSKDESLRVYSGAGGPSSAATDHGPCHSVSKPKTKYVRQGPGQGPSRSSHS